jgi:valyl-tRNA synthetase
MTLLGASLDWERQYFTLDDKLSHAVTEAFVRLHEEGKIYRGNWIVNWCPQLQTALSNIEVDYLEIDGPTYLNVKGHQKSKYEFGYLHKFAYRTECNTNEIIVATTWPETMLGDTAVAVHPDDSQYSELWGKSLWHPFIKDRKLKVIRDGELVKQGLGTMAVKVTPAHDPNDFKCGVRNSLEFINIFDDFGRLNENTGKFQGLMRFDARN